MAIDIATIGLAVDTKDVKNASRDLDNLTKSGDKAAGSADGMAKSYKAAGIAIGLAAAGAVAGLVNLVKKSIDLADANSKAAQQVGVHIEKLTALQHAANLAGVNSQQLNDGLLRFSKTISEAEQGTKSAVAIFSDLGIKLKDNEGQLKTTDNLLLEVAESFSGYADGATKTAAAQELFGRSGAQLIPMLNQGAKGISELMKQAEALGLVMDQKTATAAENFNDSLTVLQGSFSGVINRVSQQLTPTLIELTGIFLDVAQDTSTATTAANVFAGVLKGLVSIAVAVSSAFSTVGTALGGLIAANLAVLRGDFKGAWNILKDTATDAATSVEKAIDRITKLWTGEYKDAGNTAIAISKALTDSKKQLVRTTEEEAGATTKAVKAVEDYNIKLQEQIQDLAIVNYWLEQGMELEEARLRVQLARNGATAENLELMVKETARQKELLSIEEARKKLIEDTKKANQKASDDYLREVKKAEEKRRDAHKKTADELQRSITDALLRGFENGLGFAQNFKDTLINMFKTLVLRPVIEAIVSPVSGAISGAMNGGGISSLFGGGSNSLIGTLKTGFDSLNNNVVGSIRDLGSFLSSGNGGLADKLGGFLGTYSSTIAKALPFAGAALSLLSGDIKGAAFQGAGAAIGTAFGGPIGGAIGSFLGKAVGGLFGGSGEKYKQVIQQRTGTYSGGDFLGFQGKAKRSSAGLAGGLDGLNQTFSQNLGALLAGFGIDDSVNTSSMVRLRRTSGRTAGTFGASFAGGSVSMGGRDWQFGGKGDIGAGFQQFAARVLGEGLSKAIQASAVPAGIKKFFEGVANNAAIVETINAVVGLNKALRELPPIFDAIDFALFTTSFNVGIKQLQEDFTATQKYTELFYTQQENFDTFTRQLQAQFSDLNVVMPTTRDAFRALVDGIEVTSEATYNQLQALIRLAPASDAYFKALEEQGQLLGQISRLDMSRFRTFTDFAIASSYTRQGLSIPAANMPSYAVGTAYVPNDGVAMLHQGEAVLNRSDNASLGENTGKMVSILSDMRSEIAQLKYDIKRGADGSQRTARELEDISSGNVVILTEAA